MAAAWWRERRRQDEIRERNEAADVRRLPLLPSEETPAGVVEIDTGVTRPDPARHLLGRPADVSSDSSSVVLGKADGVDPPAGEASPQPSASSSTEAAA